MNQTLSPVIFSNQGLKHLATLQKRFYFTNCRERHTKEEILLAAKVKVACDTEAEELQTIEDQKRYEERQRLLAQRIRELEAKEAANNLKVDL